MEGELGLNNIKLFSENAPITARNFLKYINENRYKDFHFYQLLI